MGCEVLEVLEVVEVEVEVKGTVDLLFISGSCSIETLLECTAYFGGGLDDDYDEKMDQHCSLVDTL